MKVWEGLLNIAIGYKALNKNFNGNGNIAIGIEMRLLKVAEILLLGYTINLKCHGDCNIGIGGSLRNNKSHRNIGIGHSSLSSNVYGKSNVAIGGSTLFFKRRWKCSYWGIINDTQTGFNKYSYRE